MRFITKQEVRKSADRAISRSGIAIASAQIQTINNISRHVLIVEARNRTLSANSTFDVFLSHANKDAEYVLGIRNILTEQGLVVYVDWIDDPQLDRSKVTAETAELLRQRMRKSACLLYLATESSTDSRWMPWELGYFDGIKSDSIWILPIVDFSGEQFNGQEYLGLYPCVMFENNAFYLEKRGSWSITYEELKSFVISRRSIPLVNARRSGF